MRLVAKDGRILANRPMTEKQCWLENTQCIPFGELAVDNTKQDLVVQFAREKTKCGYRKMTEQDKWKLAAMLQLEATAKDYIRYCSGG